MWVKSRKIPVKPNKEFIYGYFFKNFVLFFSNLLLFLQILRTTILNNASQWLLLQQWEIKLLLDIWKFWQWHRQLHRYSNINVVFYTINCLQSQFFFYMFFIFLLNMSLKLQPKDWRPATVSENLAEIMR